MGLGEHAGMLLCLWHLVLGQNIRFPQVEAGDSKTERGRNR